MAEEEDIPSYSYDPDKAWSIISVKQTVKTVKPLAHSSPKPPGHTRFVCISDTHSRTNGLQVPAGDVLLHAGDFTNIGLPKDVERFRKFLDHLPHPHKVVIAGNHDLTFDVDNYESLWQRFGHPHKFDCQALRSLVTSAPGVSYLEDSGTTINGISIWGSPWQPEFGGWAFNLERGLPCRQQWDLIPTPLDVLITHGPPIGHGDQCQHGGRAGCVQLLHTIQQRVQPAYHVFGHIHEGYGVTTDGQTTFVNCSTCNFYYRPLNSAIIFDIPNKM